MQATSKQGKELFDLYCSLGTTRSTFEIRLLVSQSAITGTPILEASFRTWASPAGSVTNHNFGLKKAIDLWICKRTRNESSKHCPGSKSPRKHPRRILTVLSLKKQQEFLIDRNEIGNFDEDFDSFIC